MHAGDRPQDVRIALSRLVTHGADAAWLPEAQPLLGLPLVRMKIGERTDRDAGSALREALQEAVARLGESQYQGLLSIVLGLDPSSAELSATERRALAGQQFRGGRKPVRPGTIRQYHEPRALDQLTEILLSGPEAEPTPSAPPEAELSQASQIEWHPRAREAWAGERLSYWRLAFSTYDRDAAVERIRLVTGQADVRSWALYEVLGAYDLLLRAWLPDAPRTFELALHEAFRGDAALLVDYFEVTDIVTHWPWAIDGSMRDPSADVLARPLPSRELDRIEDPEADDETRRAYEQLNLITTSRADDSGIGVVVAVSAPRHPLTTAVTEELRQRIAAVVHDSGLSCQSLYLGVGFGTVLIQGRVRPERFQDLRDRLVIPISESVQLLGCRTTTLILASVEPTAQQEEMRRGNFRDAGLVALDWLQRDESADFEVIGSAFSRLPPDLEPEGSAKKARNTDPLLRAITGFLNSQAGTLLIGALENEKFGHDPRLRGAPRVGKYVVCGIDGELEMGKDAFQRRLQDAWRAGIEPDPSAYLTPSFEEVDGRTVCLIEVRGSDAPAWFWHRPSKREARFFVRQGSRTLEFVGSQIDAYRQATDRAAR